MTDNRVITLSLLKDRALTCIWMVQKTSMKRVGRICNDGSFPFALLRSKFGRLIQERVNCVFAKPRGDVWIKAKRDISANEELLLCYTDDLSCWKAIFSDQQLECIKEVLRQCPPTLRDAEEAIRALSI